jgi:hypothetical protein
MKVQLRSRFRLNCFLAVAVLAGLHLVIGGAAQTPAAQTPAAPAPTAQAQELPVHRIPNLGPGAEFYFAPDNQHIIGNAKRDGDSSYHVYTLKIDGTEITRINDKGDDACSFFFPNGRRIIWTSTKDHPEFDKPNFSNPNDYPQSAELYTSNLDGSYVKRPTKNAIYDAEV